MEVKEAIELKESLERAFAESLASFCDQTGVMVSNVAIERFDANDSEGKLFTRTYSVRIFAHL